MSLQPYNLRNSLQRSWLPVPVLLRRLNMPRKYQTTGSQNSPVQRMWQSIVPADPRHIDTGPFLLEFPHSGLPVPALPSAFRFPLFPSSLLRTDHPGKLQKKHRQAVLLLPFFQLRMKSPLNAVPSENRCSVCPVSDPCHNLHFNCIRKSGCLSVKKCVHFFFFYTADYLYFVSVHYFHRYSGF